MSMKTKLGIHFWVVLFACIDVWGQDDNIQDYTLADAGGYRIALHIEGSGNHTVVVEAGVGEWSLHWREFQSKLAETGGVRVVTYDRAGYGLSDPSPYARTVGQIAEELHTALASVEIRPPYVLLGHSYGGMIAKAFVNKFPSEVEGIILAESASEHQFEQLPSVVTTILENGKISFRQTSLAIRTGKLDTQFVPEDSTMSPPYRRAHQLGRTRASYYDAMYNEMYLLPISYMESNFSGSINIPLLVMTAGNSFGNFLNVVPNLSINECNAAWTKLQNKLPFLSTQSRHIVIESATHSLTTTAEGRMIDEMQSFLKQLR